MSMSLAWLRSWRFRRRCMRTARRYRRMDPHDVAAELRETDEEFRAALGGGLNPQPKEEA